MSSRIFAAIRPALLIWARESAGLPQDVAAKRIGVSAERLFQWEIGEDRPSIPQLRKAATVYKRPLAVFFLPAAPQMPTAPHDYRRLSPEGRASSSPELLFELRRARRRRSVALEIAADLQQRVEEFTIAANLDDDPDRLADFARDWLGITVGQQGMWRGDYGPLNGWLSIVESRQVLVFQTSEVSLDEMRGVSISEYPMPAIVLNATDAPRGRVFTLAHELAHLFLRNGGICDPTRVSGAGTSADERVEVFCNRVAGAILVPADDLMREPLVRHAEAREQWQESVLRELADRYAVSREVILRRLLILGRTTEEFYENKREEYRRQFFESRERAREVGGFAPYSRVVVRDNGRRYTRLVLEALERDQITAADVSDYLGVSLKHLGDIAEAVAGPGE